MVRRTCMISDMPINAFLLIAALGLGSTSASVSTLETSVTVEAREDAPRLISLGLQGELSWSNRAAAALPNSETHPLHWQLDRASSQFGPTQIQLVYRNESPRLKLVWSWTARARRGPIEHEVVS